MSDFKVLETIGVGWFGKVDLAEWGSVPRAVKAVEKERAARLGQAQHLVSERRLLLALNHPFIVKWYPFPLIIATTRFRMRGMCIL